MENRERICRFCFKHCDTCFKAVDGGTQEILNMLLITMNITISNEPVMCTNCSETLQNSFVFKKTWLDVRDRTIAFGNDKNDGHAVCEFCANMFEYHSFSMLDVEDKILEKYFPELDVSANKKPSICEVCHGSLVNFYSFITTSAIVEEKIREYCEVKGVNNEDPIKLNNVVQFASNNIWTEKNVFEIEDMISDISENEETKIQRVCALCLVKCENFKTIDGKTKNILDILLPKVDITVIQNPVMCKNCEEMLIKCFDFKAKCLYIQNYVVSFLKKSDVQLDLKDVYLSKNVTSPGVAEDQDICGFCMDLVNNWSAVPLDVEKGDVMLEKMIKECLSELDLSINKRPVFCSCCHEVLKDCFHFVNICSIVGAKIKKYCETLHINSKCQIDLNGLLQPTLLDVTREAEGNLTATVKVEQFCEDRENVDEREICNGDDTDKLEEIFFDDSEAAIKDIENKNKFFMEVNNQEVNNEQQFTPKNKLACTEERNKIGSVKIEETFCGEDEENHEIEDQKFLLNEEIEIKTEDHDFNRFEDDIALPQPEVAANSYNRKKYLMTNLGDLSKSYIKRTSKSKKGRKTTMLKCYLCSFQAKDRFTIKSHLLKHRDPLETTMYKCDHCLFRTKHKVSFKGHLLTHMDPSEVPVYKCASCIYQTKFKHALRKHLLVHKKKNKQILKRHLIVHKNPPEVTVHTCDYCSFQTVRKNNMNSHLLTHRDLSEVTIYKCDSCLYQSKFKYALKKHLLVHKDPSEVAMVKCNSCSFQTKRKSNLKVHLLQHRDPSEVTKYACSTCSFRTKFRYSLTKHNIRHKNPSEITMYTCDSCSYQTKYKGHHKRHILRHKNPSKVYKCDSCSYQTKYKDYLKNHLRKHKNPSKVTTYKCDYCSLQTKYIHVFKKHLNLHKKPLEVTVYKCDCCSFHTKRKNSLERHQLTHKKSKKQ